MITKVKRNKDTDNLDSPENMFTPPTAEIFEDHDGENASDPRYDALAKQLADLQTQLSDQQKTNMALLQQPPQFRSQVDQLVEIKPESIALPDPALDPDGYDKATAQRNQIRWENKQRKDEFDARRREEVSNKVEDLWNSFSDKYPDMAGDKDRIDFVATQISKAAQRRGIDVERYMFVTQDKFLDDVAKKYIDVFGEPEGEDNQSDFEDTPQRRRAAASPARRDPPRRRNRSEDDDMVSRTGGIFGGNESGGRPSRSRDDDENGPNMIDDIQALQRKTGFF